MFRVWFFRRFSQSAELGSIHAQILSNLKNSSKFGPELTRTKISDLLLSYPTTNDKIFISCISEISEYPNFSSVFKTLEPKIIENLKQFPLSEITKISQAYSKAFSLSEKLFSLICERISLQLEEMTLYDAGLLVYSFHSADYKNLNIINTIGNKCLQLIDQADKTELFKLYKSFSYYPSCTFVQKAIPAIDSQIDLMTAAEQINFLELFWKCQITGSSLEKIVFDNLKRMDCENFAILVNKCSRHPEVAKKYLEKLLKNLGKRNPEEFSSKAIMYTVHGMHEMVIGREVCMFFSKHLEERLDKIELEHICVIMYVFGIKAKGSRFMWRRFAEIVKKDLEKLSHIEKVWALYGLFKAERLKPDFMSIIMNSMNDKDFAMKDIEKIIEVCNGMKDLSTLKRIKPFFVQKFKEFYPNKGLICVDAYVNAEMMDSELYNIMKIYKSKIKHREN